jgi:hypothetical protein
MDFRVKGFQARWGSEFHLGPFVDWHATDQVDIGVNLGPLILGIRFLRGNRIIDPNETDRQPRWELGTRLSNRFGNWRYCRAGEDIEAKCIVQPSLSGRVMANEGLPAEQELNEAIYGDIRAITDPDSLNRAAFGFPEVSVRRGRYFWTRELPADWKFEKKAKS